MKRPGLWHPSRAILVRENPPYLRSAPGLCQMEMTPQPGGGSGTAVAFLPHFIAGSSSNLHAAVISSPPSGLTVASHS